MRHVVKYLLFLAILMSGFYMARKFRAPDAVDLDAAAPSGVDAENPAFVHGDIERTPVKTQLPVAALVDIDKSPTRGAFESGQFGNPSHNREMGFDAEGPTVRKQPTVKSSSKTHAKGPSKPKRNRHDDGLAARQRNTDNAGQRSTDQSADETDDSTARSAYDPSYDDPLPDFAEQYQPWLDPLDEMEHSERSATNDVDSEDVWGQTASVDRPKAKTSGPQRHEIAVGDTLELLAQKYFGDQERQLEIYEANRDILFHPRLLPIGVEISIPGSIETAMAAAPDELDDETVAANPWAYNDEDEQVDDEESPIDPWSEADDTEQVEGDAARGSAAEQPAEEDVAEESAEAAPAEAAPAKDDAMEDEYTDYSSWRSAR